MIQDLIFLLHFLCPRISIKFIFVCSDQLDGWQAGEVTVSQLQDAGTQANKHLRWEEYSLGNPEWFIPVPDPASTFKEFRIRPQLFLKCWFF